MGVNIDFTKEKKEYEEVLGLKVRKSQFERRIRMAFKVYIFDLRTSLLSDSGVQEDDE